MSGWLVMLGVLALWRLWLPPMADLPASHDEQQVLQLRQQVELLQRQRELLANYGHVADTFQRIPAVIQPLPDMAPQRRAAWINAGTDQGIAVGQAVVDDQGLVGVIEEVAKDSAWIMLADDIEYRVLFTTPDGRTGGILHGGPKVGEVVSGERRNSTPLEEGATLMTAGGDGRHPRGLLIGFVTELRQSGLQATAQLASRVRREGVVLVLAGPSRKRQSL